MSHPNSETREQEGLRRRIAELEQEVQALRKRAGDEASRDEGFARLRHAQAMAAAGSRIRELKQTRDSLRTSKAWLRAILDSATDYAIITLDLDGRITSWNSGARNVLGWDESEVLGRPIEIIFTPEERDAGLPRAEMQTALATGLARNERWHLRKDGSLFWGNGVLQPFRDDSLLGYVKILRDRTEERRNEQNLHASEERAREILESISDAFYAVDREWRFTYINRKAEELWGRRREDLIGRIYWEEFPEAVGTEATEARRIAMQERRAVRLETVSRVLGGWVDVSIYPTSDGGLSVYFRDNSQQKRAEERLRLLLNELNHRVKNTLATVQSIATQTLRTAESPQQARAAIESRLIALSRAHDVLTRANWEGASLSDVVQQAIEPHQGSCRRRFEVRGPDAHLPPRMALAIAMALQELCTNAVKYGALSNETGYVAIVWSLERSADGQRLEMCWTEHGGPPVHPPQRQGFGTRLIERSLAQELDGTVKVEFAPAGVVCSLSAPLEEDGTPQ